MAQEAVDSPLLAQLASQPISMLSSGEGAPGEIRVVTDYVSPTASGMGTIGSVYRLCRVPTYAKIKRVDIHLPAAFDTSSIAVFQFNMAFSDSLYDGTGQAYTANNGLTSFTSTCLPQTGQAGTTTSVVTYTNANVLFGSVTATNAIIDKDITFNGTYAAGGAGNGPNVAWVPAGREYPLWQFFGFTDAQGYVQDPGGFFDLMAVLSTAATTAAAFTFGASIMYTV